MSPDEENLYVAGGEADTLVVFDRAAGSGALQPAGCFRRPGASTACGGEAARLNGPNSVVVTPDGRNVYVDGYDAASIVEFSRAAGGNMP